MDVTTLREPIGTFFTSMHQDAVSSITGKVRELTNEAHLKKSVGVYTILKHSSDKS